MLTLPVGEVRRKLQALFRAQHILKVWQFLYPYNSNMLLNKVHVRVQVGYGLANDLWAIAAAIGAEGAGCIAVVQPQVDVARVHRELRHRQALDNRKVPLVGMLGNPAPTCVTDAREAPAADPVESAGSMGWGIEGPPEILEVYLCRGCPWGWQAWCSLSWGRSWTRRCSAAPGARGLLAISRCNSAVTTGKLCSCLPF